MSSDFDSTGNAVETVLAVKRKDKDAVPSTKGATKLACANPALRISTAGPSIWLH
jgi:hypothetical protein